MWEARQKKARVFHLRFALYHVPTMSGFHLILLPTHLAAEHIKCLSMFPVTTFLPAASPPRPIVVLTCAFLRAPRKRDRDVL